MKRIILLSICLLVISIDYLLAQDPFIPKYQAIRRSQRCFTITRDMNNQFGSVWFRDKMDFSQSQTLDFVIYMGNKNGGNRGADGIAFVMHNDPRDTINNPAEIIPALNFPRQGATGDAGGGLGYAFHNSNPQMRQAIRPSVAIEIDTYDNNNGTWAGDATFPGGTTTEFRTNIHHTSVVYNGDLYSQQQVIKNREGVESKVHRIKPLPEYQGPAQNYIDDNLCYAFRIKWIVNGDGTQTLELWIDNYDGTTNTDNLILVMRHTDNMLDGVFGGTSLLRYGFTGSTGGARNEQTICLLGENLAPYAVDDYASTLVNTPVVIDVEANDNDPDGDHLSIPYIQTPPRNGVAEVVSIGNQDHVRYTPNVNFVGRDSLQYRTCDVDSDKCYAKCDDAWVYITVGCIDFTINAEALTANVSCDPDLPGNASAQVLSANLMMWYENFHLPNGTTVDTGETAWQRTLSAAAGGSTIAHVLDSAFTVSQFRHEVTLTTEEIDISLVDKVEFSVSASSSTATGSIPAGAYIRVFYKVDGGPEIPANNGQVTGNFGTAQPRGFEIEGNTLQIIIRMSNSQGGHYKINSILVRPVGVELGNIQYDWYAGLDQSGSSIHTGQVINGLRHGTYTVVGRDVNTGCRSLPAVVEIDSTGIILNGFIVNVSPYTSCVVNDGAMRAGVVVDGDSVTTGYDFNWYYRELPRAEPLIATGPAANNLEGREYTVVIRDQISGCEVLVSDEVNQQVVIPNVEGNVVQHVTSCDDPESGIMQATILGGSNDNYDFEWYEGMIAASVPPSFTGERPDQVPAGTYYLIAIDKITGCVSDPAIVVVDEELVQPEPVVVANVANTACEAEQATGVLQGATLVNGVETTDGYNFFWYRGASDVNPAREGYTGGAIADRLVAGTYRLVVTHDESGCSAFIDAEIDENIALPVINEANAFDNTSCGDPNGRIEVTPQGDLTAYFYRIYSGHGVVSANLMRTEDLPVFSGLAEGNYTVTIVDKISLCESEPVMIRIEEVTVFPEAELLLENQISCDPAAPTGAVAANPLNGNISEFSYEWRRDGFSGTVISSTAGTNGERIEGLAAGTYAMIITNPSNECTNQYLAVVVDAKVDPVITQAVALPNTFCFTDRWNGSISVTMATGNPEDYTYTWMRMPGSQVIAGENSHEIGGLQPGNYRVRATSLATTCISATVSVTVENRPVTPVPNVLVTDDTSCDRNPNGALEVISTNETDALTYALYDYTYEWRQGILNVNNFYNSAPDNVGNPITGLSQGNQTLRIYNNETGCVAIAHAKPGKNPGVVPEITEILVQNITGCDPEFLGRIEVSGINNTRPNPDVPMDIADFTFTWERKTGNNQYQVIAGANENILEDVTTGTYRVIAVTSAGGCSSRPSAEIPVVNTAEVPQIALRSFPNTDCSTENTGSIEMTYTGIIGIRSISLWQGSLEITNFDLLDGPAANIKIFYGLSAGTYTVRLTDNQGCETSAPVQIGTTPGVLPLISVESTEEVTDCVDGNGAVTLRLSQVLTLPWDAATYRSYTFYLLEGTSFPESEIANATEGNMAEASTADPLFTFENLMDGRYMARVRDNITGCISNAVPVLITVRINMRFNFAPVAPTSCNPDDDPDYMPGEIFLEARSLHDTPSHPNNYGAGEIRPPDMPVSETGTGAGYEFTWWKGKIMDDDNIYDSEMLNKWISHIKDLESGYYRVKVKDLETQCAADTLLFLPTEAPVEYPIVTGIDAIHCNPGDGKIHVEIVLSEKVEGEFDFEDYEIIVFKHNAFDPNDFPFIPAPTPVDYSSNENFAGFMIGSAQEYINEMDNVAPGWYTVVAREKKAWRCFSPPVDVEVLLDLPIPTLSAITTDDNSCDDDLANGAIDLTVTGLVAGTTFDYTWHTGTSTEGDELDAMHQGLNNPSGLLAGHYTALVEIQPGSPAGIGCTFTHTAQIAKNLLERRLETQVTPNDVCLIPGNGEIWVSNVSVDDLSSYTEFAIFNPELEALPGQSGAGTDADRFNQLSPGRYYIQALHTLSGCLSELAETEIIDISQAPTLELAQLQANYICDENQPGTGIIELQIVPDDGGDYTIEWFKGHPDGDELNLLAGLREIQNLQNAAYAVVVTDAEGVNEGCANSTWINLSFEQTILSLDAVATDQNICAPNGTIAVREINWKREELEQDFSPDFDTDRFEIVFYDENLEEIDNGNVSFDPVTHTWAGLAPGSYYVAVREKDIHCDLSAPVLMVISDVSQKPVLTVSLDNPDFACEGGTPTGILSAMAEGGSDQDDNQANFLFTWYDANDNVIMPEGLSAGITYRVMVQDGNGLDQFCESEREFTVTRETQPLAIATAVPTDKTFCIDNGVIEVTGIRFDGVDISMPDAGFNIQLKDADGNNIAVDAGTTYTSLGEGLYFATVQNASTLCNSQPFQVRIQDVSTNPLVSISLDSAQYSLNPDSDTWSGALSGSALEINGIAASAGYGLSWYNMNNQNIGNDETLVGLDKGIYMLTALNLETQCEGSAQYELPLIVLKPSPTLASFPQVICAPTGSIEVTAVQLSGVPGNMASYTFYWYPAPYQAGMDPIHTQMGDDFGTILTDLAAGTYYVMAEHNRWKLRSDLVKVVVDDESQSPLIVLDPSQSRNQTSCDPETLANGALAVNVFEQDNSIGTYTYQWYAGESTLPPSLALAQEVQAVITGKTSGYYTIWVQNDQTLCTASRKLVIKDEINRPLLSGSASPLTFCHADAPNGAVLASVINSTSGFEYAWFIGDQIKTQPDYMGRKWENIPAGLYTVVATDDELFTCTSAPLVVEVKDETRNPVVLVTDLYPLTYCDPNRPNAAMTATTQSGITNYEFEWYDASGNLHITGPTGSALSDQLYKVVAMHRITGCSSDAPAQPTVAYDLIDRPAPEVLRDRTSCNVPDGEATALVNGNRTQYNFYYYQVHNDRFLSDNPFIDNVIYELDSSSYYVMAEHRISGCISPQSIFHIAAELYYPEFDVVTTPSACTEPTGTARVILKDIQRQHFTTWYKDGYFVNDDIEAVNIAQGEYEAEVEGSDGCISTKIARVDTDITIYNGVSANNDGMNDFFQVLCLEYFPSNHVKIFNRAGVLVYEMSGYDINDHGRRFNGASNRGIQMGKDELPIGTYFYIVDKGDGSEAKVGYLELVR
ncbi:MAG: gliding motility-associated C-terminal domain-containing protein [Cyclobacteriaceae bacterium]|nr:gliding motility-associated C-terminal domain-containing protein [Cyclobacteriaceae bacterium]